MEERYGSQLTTEEKQSAWAAICHYHFNELTSSVYCLNCDTAELAEKKAFEYFFSKIPGDKKSWMQILRIDILPRGAGRWDSVLPVFSRAYKFVSPINSAEA